MVFQPFLCFLEYLTRGDRRDYIILVDVGPAMTGAAIEQANDVLSTILPVACRADEDGITLIPFGSREQRLKNLTSAPQALSAFRAAVTAMGPQRSTQFDPALQSAVTDHVEQRNNPTHRTAILVVTAGHFSDQNRALLTIGSIITMFEPSNVSLSFLQVGNNAAGAAFLDSLPDDVQACCSRAAVDCLLLADIADGAHGLVPFLQQSTARQSGWPWGWPSRNGARSHAGGGSAPPSPTHPPPPVGLNHVAFYRALVNKQEREYEVLVDCGEKVSPITFNFIRMLLATTLGSALELDSDGITLRFIQGAESKSAGNIKSGEDIDKNFMRECKGRSAQLSLPLRVSFNECLKKPNSRPTSVLVIIASAPRDLTSTVDEVRKFQNQVASDNLTVTFLNVGTDPDQARRVQEEFEMDASYPAFQSNVDFYHLPVSGRLSISELLDKHVPQSIRNPRTDAHAVHVTEEREFHRVYMSTFSSASSPI